MTQRSTIGLAMLFALVSAPAFAQSAGVPDQSSRFAVMDAMRIHYRSLGEGETALVFVHGWACDLTFWRFQVPEFEGKIRIVLLDLPGHGLSDKPTGVVYNLDLFARSIHAVLQDAGVRHAVLVGQSIGVPIIRQFSRRYPDETRALVVANGPLRSLVPFGTDSESRAQRAAFEARVRRMEEASASEFMAQVTATAEGWFVPQTTREVREIVVSTLVQTPAHVAASATAGTFEPQFWEEDPIRVPLLVILANIPTWSRQNEDYVRTIAPQVDYHLMDGVGHFVMLEQPAAFNAMLTSFLRRQGVMKP